MPKKLPPGWSWPLKPSEVELAVPGFGRVGWSQPWGPSRNSRPTDEGWLVSARWAADPGLMPPPKLSLYAVPSVLKQALRDELVGTAASSIERWRAQSDDSEGGRLLDHYEGWLWRSDGSVYRDPSSD